MRVLHVTTVPMSLRFLRGQAAYMRAHGIELVATTSPGEELDAFARSEDVPVHAVEMQRAITPLRDLGALRALVRVVQRVRPQVLHAHTPKGGLLGMIAGTFARVPVRIYHMRGLPYVTATGARRALLMSTERVSCALADRVLCVSHTLRETALADGLCPPGRIRVLGAGSGNGVDATGLYDPERYSAAERSRMRAELGIPEAATVALFVGRLAHEKGVGELLTAWQTLRAAHADAHLVLLGPVEGDELRSVLDVARSDERVHFAGMHPNAAAHYALSDVVVLPTYREGFPNVLLEAAAMRLPVVATRIPGCVDAVEEHVTGVLVPARDAAALGSALGAYLASPELRARHGEAARVRVLREFDQRRLWEGIRQEYVALCERAAVLPAAQPRGAA